MAEKIIHRTYKFRLYPTKRQVNDLNAHLAICCELYNAAVQERREAWRVSRIQVSRQQQARQLTDVKTIRDDVATVNAIALENVIDRVDRAYGIFFNRIKARRRAGLPRYRSFSRYRSMTFRQIGQSLSGDRLRISKIGKVKIKVHQPMVGEIKTMTVKREGDRWYAYFVVQRPINPLPSCRAAIGVDVGITTFAMLSNGESIANPRYYQTNRRSVVVATRRMSRRVKGSKRREKAVTLLARAHGRIRNQRRDFHHKVARVLVDNFGLIAVEKLNLSGMVRFNLSKFVLDAGWCNFINKVTEKAEDAARTMIKVAPHGTSQTCLCGAEVRKTLDQRWHLCLNCGLSANRDHVSAQVILGRGLRLQDSTWAAAPCVS